MALPVPTEEAWPAAEVGSVMSVTNLAWPRKGADQGPRTPSDPVPDPTWPAQPGENNPAGPMPHRPSSDFRSSDIYPVQRVSSTQPGGTSEQSSDPAASITSKPGNPAGREDPTWRRLQTIYDLHQAKGAAAETTIKDEQSSDATPKKVSPPAVENRQSAPLPQASPQAVSRPRPEITYVNRQAPPDMVGPKAGAVSPAPLDSSTAERITSPADDQLSLKPEASRLESRPEPGARPTSQIPEAERAEPETDNLAVPARNSDDIIQRSAGSAERQVVPLEPQGVQPQPATPADKIDAEVDDIDQNPVEFEQPVAELPLNSTPLEAAWPVQRKTSAPASPPVRSQIEPVSTDETLLEVEAELTHNQAQVQMVLEKIQAGQPTRSGIEVITPRRPRPSASGRENALPKEQPAGSVPQADISDHAPEIVQTKQERPAAEPDLIPTDIGPLPSDLWQLLGQTPPARQPVEKPALSSAVSSSSAVANLDELPTAEPEIMPAVVEGEEHNNFPPQRAPVKPEPAPGSQPETPDKRRTATADMAAKTATTDHSRQKAQASESVVQPNESVIQTSPDILEPPADEPLNLEEDDQQPIPELDLDRLAHQVYARLRRKLAIEQERYNRL